MFAEDKKLPEVHIQPGETCLVRNPAILCTVLGSCVGITFRSPRLSVAALCHPMLPACPGNSDLRAGSSSGRRYVDYTIRELAHKLDELGAARSEVEVKLFGGANVLPLGDNSSKRPTVGRQNMEMAIQMLRTEGFRVSTSSLGGNAGVSIQFNTNTGEVLLRRLRGSLLEGSAR